MGKMVTSLSSSQSSLRNNSNSSSNSNSNNRIEKQQQEQHNQEKKQIPLLFAHHDINFANVIAIYPGQIQWNDFNLGIINQTGYLSLHEGNTPQAADVYSLGNVLFQVLTRHQPWTHLEINNETKIVTQGVTKSEKEYSLSIVAKAKLDGRLPNLPERYISRSEAKILWQAIQNCFQHNPKDRPLALDVANYLGNAYNVYNRKYVK